MKYVVLLRGVNVGGRNRMKMTDLCTCLTDAGVTDVQSYIQSGNLVCDWEGDPSALQKLIAASIKACFSMSIAVWVLAARTIKHAVNCNPFGVCSQDCYVHFPSESLNQIAAKTLMSRTFINERIHIEKDLIFTWAKNGVGRAKLNSRLIEKDLGVKTTARNRRTLTRLLALLTA